MKNEAKRIEIAGIVQNYAVKLFGYASVGFFALLIALAFGELLKRVG